MKNVCQTCLFDLEFGLPVELRDKFVKENSGRNINLIPQETSNRDFWANEMNRNIDSVQLPFDDPETKAALAKIADKINENKKPED